MKRLSEYKNEEAIILLADLIEPLAKIMGNEELRTAYKKGGMTKAGLVAIAMKSNAKEVVQVLAILDGEDPEKYEITALQIPAKLMQALNDPDLMAFWKAQGQQMQSAPSTSAPETTKGRKR